VNPFAHTSTPAADSACTPEIAGSKPALTEQVCQVKANCHRYRWHAEPWAISTTPFTNVCSDNCLNPLYDESGENGDFNYRNRKVTCYDIDLMEAIDVWDDYRLLPDFTPDVRMNCDPALRPASTETCNLHACNASEWSWRYTEWDPCSNSCGTGTKTRTPWCVNNTLEAYFAPTYIMGLLYCGGSPPEPVTQSCTEWIWCPAPAPSNF